MAVVVSWLLWALDSGRMKGGITVTELTPRDHALLFALLAREVVGRAGEERDAQKRDAQKPDAQKPDAQKRGAQVLHRAVWRYGQERGRRMAQRAMAAGQPLDWVTYMAYGEWRAPEGWQRSETLATAPDLVRQVTLCPWHQAWLDHDLLPYGRHYCLTIDAAIAAGFNPYLRLVVDGTLAEGAEACTFIFQEANLTPKQQARLDALRASLGDSAVRPWDYHLAHLAQTMGEVLVDELGEVGRQALEAGLHAAAESPELREWATQWLRDAPRVHVGEP